MPGICSTFLANTAYPKDHDKLWVKGQSVCAALDTECTIPCVTGTATTDLGAQFSTLTAGKSEYSVNAICDACYKKCTQADDKKLLESWPRCAKVVFTDFTAGLAEAFSAATAGQPESAMPGICSTFLANTAYPKDHDKLWVKGQSVCAAFDVECTIPCVAGTATTNLGAEFSTLTAGKSEAAIMGFCHACMAKCTHADDKKAFEAWPRCAAR